MPNLVTNGDFENGGTGWTSVAATIEAGAGVSGSAALRLSPVGYISEPETAALDAVATPTALVTEPGINYTVSLAYNGYGAPDGSALSIEYQPHGAGWFSLADKYASSETNEFHTWTASFTAARATTGVRLKATSPDGDTPSWDVDNVVVEVTDSAKVGNLWKGRRGGRGR